MLPIIISILAVTFIFAMMIAITELVERIRKAIKDAQDKN